MPTDPPSLRDSLPTLEDVVLNDTGPPGPMSMHPPDRGMLVQTTGLETGRVVPLSEDVVTIGRDPSCVVRVADEGAAPVHARVLREGDRWFAEDAGGGLFVDEAPTDRIELVPGTHVQLASVTLRFQLVDADEEAALSRVFATSTRDGLTGLFNATHLAATLAADIAYARRHDEQLSVAVLDVVGMGLFNARHGHAIGDALFRAIAGRVHEAAGEVPLFRSAGDELTLVIRAGAEVSARRLGERVCAALAAAPFAVEDETVPVSLHVGVACLGPGEDGAALLARARVR